MKFIVNSSCLETNFSELIDPVVCLDSIKKREILIEEVRHKQEGFNRYLKKKELEINLTNKKRRWLILRSYLTEETMLLSLQMNMVQ